MPCTHKWAETAWALRRASSQRSTMLGTAVSTLEVQLCDQHGAELESLQDEHFSIVLCVQVDT